VLLTITDYAALAEVLAKGAQPAKESPPAGGRPGPAR